MFSTICQRQLWQLSRAPSKNDKGIDRNSESKSNDLRIRTIGKRFFPSIMTRKIPILLQQVSRFTLHSLTDTVTSQSRLTRLHLHGHWGYKEPFREFSQLLHIFPFLQYSSILLVPTNTMVSTFGQAKRISFFIVRRLKRVQSRICDGLQVICFSLHYSHFYSHVHPFASAGAFFTRCQQVTMSRDQHQRSNLTAALVSRVPSHIKMLMECCTLQKV